MSLSELPYNVLENIISFCQQTDLVALSCTNDMLHYKVNQYLYKQIVIIDSKLSNSQYSVLNIEKLGKFVETLNVFNFQFIKKLLIHSQTNLIEYDYCPLYEKLIELWDVSNHVIYFVNFDINNLRNLQSFNQFILSNSITYIENEDDFELTTKNQKINNLKNWMIFDCDELSSLPFNENLVDLDICIEQSISFNPIKALNQNILNNLRNLNGLYLNTPLSTSLFVRLFENQLTLNNIKKLSITNSHSFKDGSLLTFNSINNIIRFNCLKEFELKVNCSHQSCDCIIQFLNDWFSGVNNADEINLNKLVLINYKSNNSKQNLNQFKNLFSSNFFNKNLQSIEEIYLNINDFIKLDNNQFNMIDLLLCLSDLTNLKTLIIHDFFYNWINSLPILFNERFKTSFDLLVNECKCTDCVQTRSQLNNLSKIDSNNNYKHEFNLQSDTQLSSRVEYNKPNLTLLNYLISNLKKQFIYIDQNLFSICSILNSNDKPFINNSDLLPFNRLFLHCCLFKLINLLKANNPNLNLINLGGILIEFDQFNHIKSPYNE